jgi:NADH-quinone oxidoreductase subunit H
MQFNFLIILNLYLKKFFLIFENTNLNHFNSIVYFIHIAAISLFKILFILGMVAFYTIAERKIMAAVQRRKGPNVVGFFGLLQPLADGFKLIIKEVIVPTHSISKIYLITPMIMLFLS